MVLLVKAPLSLYPIDSRMHSQDDLLGKYDKAHLVDNKLSNSTLLPALRIDIFMGPDTCPNARSTMKVRIVFFFN